MIGSALITKTPTVM